MLKTNLLKRTVFKYSLLFMAGVIGMLITNKLFLSNNNLKIYHYDAVLGGYEVLLSPEWYTSFNSEQGIYGWFFRNWPNSSYKYPSLEFQTLKKHDNNKIDIYLLPDSFFEISDYDNRIKKSIKLDWGDIDVVKDSLFNIKSEKIDLIDKEKSLWISVSSMQSLNNIYSIEPIEGNE